MRPGVILILLVCCCLVPATRGLGPLALERGWAKIDIAGYIERFLNAVGEYYEVMRYVPPHCTVGKIRVFCPMGVLGVFI